MDRAHFVFVVIRCVVVSSSSFSMVPSSIVSFMLISLRSIVLSKFAAVSPVMKMQHQMVLLQAFHTSISAPALPYKVGMCQTVDAVLASFHYT